MIRSFRSEELQRLWNEGKDLEHKTLITIQILDALDVVDLASTPQNAAFIGFRYDEWIENGQPRYGVMITGHWLISYSWSDGHAIDVDLERID